MNSPTAQPIDPTRCPLCQGDNACGVASGAGTCWCFAATIPDAVTERVPEDARGVACVCERCAAGQIAATEVPRRESSQ